MPRCGTWSWKLLLGGAVTLCVGAAVAPALLASHQRAIRHVRAWAFGARLLEDQGIVFQTSEATCGHACLMTALHRDGRNIPDGLLEQARTARVGLTVGELARLARHAGLPARIVAVPANCVEQALAGVALPAIALVGTHYLLVERPPTAGHVIVIDPGVGRLRAPVARLARDWRGIVVVLGAGEGRELVCPSTEGRTQ